MGRNISTDTLSQSKRDSVKNLSRLLLPERDWNYESLPAENNFDNLIKMGFEQ